MKIEEAQKTVDEWINQFEEGYWPPLSMLACLTEEVGELAREINHREKIKTKKGGKAGDRYRLGTGRHPIQPDMPGKPLPNRPPKKTGRS